MRLIGTDLIRFDLSHPFNPSSILNSSGGVMPLKHEDLTDKIIGAFYDVYNSLGPGFLEKVYENALYIELTKRGLIVEQQKPVKVYYGSHPVGEYYADLIVNNAVIIEVKAADGIIAAHEAQLYNYLKATEIEVGLLLNFGPSPEFRRKFLTNDRKALSKK
jgi:GxxExxY protein